MNKKVIMNTMPPSELILPYNGNDYKFAQFCKDNNLLMLWKRKYAHSQYKILMGFVREIGEYNGLKAYKVYSNTLIEKFRKGYPDILSSLHNGYYCEIKKGNKTSYDFTDKTVAKSEKELVLKWKWKLSGLMDKMKIDEVITPESNNPVFSFTREIFENSYNNTRVVKTDVNINDDKTESVFESSDGNAFIHTINVSNAVYVIVEENRSEIKKRILVTNVEPEFFKAKFR